MSAYYEQTARQLARNLAPDLTRSDARPVGTARVDWCEDSRAALLVVVIERAEQEREGRWRI